MPSTSRKHLISAGSLALLAALATPALADSPHPGSGLHHSNRHHHRRADQRKVAAVSPLPSPKPASLPVTAPTAAPTPNEGVTAPIDNSDQHTSVAPAVMQIHYPPQGDGYTSGSSAQAMDDREAAKVTGVQIKVPLGQ